MITLLGLMLYGIFLHYERPEGEHLGAPCVNQSYAIASRGQRRLYHEVLLPRQPAGHTNMKFFDLDYEGLLPSKIHDSLGEVLKLRVCPFLYDKHRKY